MRLKIPKQAQARSTVTELSTVTFQPSETWSQLSRTILLVLRFTVELQFNCQKWKKYELQKTLTNIPNNTAIVKLD